MEFCNIPRALSAFSSTLEAISICVPNSRQRLTRSSGPSFFKVFTASATSSALPTARPSGSSISDITAIVFLPARLPILTISSASSSASCIFFINAPLPTLTSSTIAPAPAAIFLLIILLAISGMLSTMAVTSLKAYIFLSAGARLPVCPVSASPISLILSINSSSLNLVLKPLILSSLSIVPPVLPSPRPLILATLPPQAATIGASISVVLSPTPPVLCLSTLMPPISDKSIISPLCAIASVRLVVSS